MYGMNRAMDALRSVNKMLPDSNSLTGIIAYGAVEALILRGVSSLTYTQIALITLINQCAIPLFKKILGERGNPVLPYIFAISFPFICCRHLDNTLINNVIAFTLSNISVSKMVFYIWDVDKQKIDYLKGEVQKRFNITNSEAIKKWVVFLFLNFQTDFFSFRFFKNKVQTFFNSLLLDGTAPEVFVALSPMLENWKKEPPKQAISNANLAVTIGSKLQPQWIDPSTFPDIISFWLEFLLGGDTPFYGVTISAIKNCKHDVRDVLEEVRRYKAPRELIPYLIKNTDELWSTSTIQELRQVNSDLCRCYKIYPEFVQVDFKGIVALAYFDPQKRRVFFSILLKLFEKYPHLSKENLCMGLYFFGCRSYIQSFERLLINNNWPSFHVPEGALSSLRHSDLLSMILQAIPEMAEAVPQMLINLYVRAEDPFDIREFTQLCDQVTYNPKNMQQRFLECLDYYSKAKIFIILKWFSSNHIHTLDTKLNTLEALKAVNFLLPEESRENFFNSWLVKKPAYRGLFSENVSLVDRMQGIIRSIFSNFIPIPQPDERDRMRLSIEQFLRSEDESLLIEWQKERLMADQPNPLPYGSIGKLNQSFIYKIILRQTLNRGAISFLRTAYHLHKKERGKTVPDSLGNIPTEVIGKIAREYLWLDEETLIGQTLSIAL